MTDEAVSVADSNAEPSPVRTPTGHAKLIHPGLPAVSAGCWIAFVGLTYLAMSRDYLPGDLSVARWVQSISWGPLAETFPIISWLTGLGQVGLALLLVIGIFFVNRRAAPFAMVAVVGDLLYWLLNLVLHKPRPLDGLIRVSEHPGSYAYPSGHAALAVTVAVVLMLCIAIPLMGRAWSIVGAIVGLLAIFTVGIERIYVGAHYPSDVLGGFLVAAAWLTLALSVDRLGVPVLREVPHRASQHGV